MARAKSRIAPTMRRPRARTCCGWHFCRSRCRPTASPAAAEQAYRKTATRSSRCPTATASSRFATTDAATCSSKAMIRRRWPRTIGCNTRALGRSQESPDASGGKLHVAEAAGATASFEFAGNQVRLMGRADPNGGKADVYLDGVKQLCGIDFWCPQARDRQVLCYKNGLAQGKHTLKIVALGTKNPLRRRHAGLRRRRAVVGRPRRRRLRRRRRPGRRSAGDLRLRRSQGLRRFARPRRGGPPLEFVMRLRTRADLVPISFWTEPNSKTWPTPTIPSCIATESTGRISRPTSP